MNWESLLKIERKKKYFSRIFNFLNSQENNGIKIFPKKSDIFNAFKYTDIKSLKVVILGQDPYYRSGQAHGFSFSVPHGVRIPNSLSNIFIEIKRDINNFVYPNHGCLINWARQGVFLLNSILTVECGKPYSHSNIGWEIFTNNVISIINKNTFNIIFLLWGKEAQKKSVFIDKKRHYVLTSSHPSSLSCNKGFFGCSHFSKTNQILLSHKLIPIDWNL